ncbi:MAG: DedA family protein [Prevotella sp.]|jgi:putative membrane protein|uniref:DedA family protein n=1 Tax=Prevotella vespertina TaxID=2608404 RepID=A0A7C9HF57_9BACT|nr:MULTISPECIES: YqaA family protein [Prevotella]EID32432.1 SNARE-like domain protein [Prevotella sp. oral taxon 306 str. F0472]MBF1625794.1 DedA family protein [Prevotella sp.]MBF1627465.1 DedA family protein [Prevotella sp.]MBF1631541.1 DedA family protein [Prevotella sp.]MBF1637003.1 DedA family protein [Prevotella sp.]
MDAITHFLIDYGYWGMFLSAFLAGSVLPFSSEAVMLGLLAAGVDPVPLLIYGSIGNVMGGMVNYGLGRLGKLEWLKKYFHLKQSSIDRAYKFMGGHGAWMGFFAFLPILGSAITVVLGLTRANLPLSVFSITLGKVIRYALLIWGANLFM